MLIAVICGKIAQYNWKTAHQGAVLKLGGSHDVAQVLTVSGSLTRFLEKEYDMKLELVLQEQFIHRFDDYEAQLLCCEERQACLRRQVSLVYQGKIMFDAESVLPLDDLPLSLMSALQDGQIPLGHLLSDCGLSLSRSDLRFCRASFDTHSRWARRSILRSFSGASALVAEYFCPDIWHCIQAYHQNRS